MSYHQRSSGSRFPPKRKRSFPILAARPTLKLAAVLVRQAAIPWRGIGALSRRRSLAGRAGAHPCSTPYSVEQADFDLRQRRRVESWIDRAAFGRPFSIRHNHRVVQRNINTSPSLLDITPYLWRIIRPLEACHFIDWACGQRGQVQNDSAGV